MSIETMKLALEALHGFIPYLPLNDEAQCGRYDEAITAIKEALAQPEPMRLRRGDILRCIETDQLCTVWSTSTTGKTLIKWGANDFGGYTAEQIGELFWLEPSPDECQCRKLVPLTDEEIKMMIPDGQEWKYGVGFSEAIEFARAIEAAHGIKENT